MSLLGIGSAGIDLILTKETYSPGEHIDGYFLIKGGTIDQKIKRIDSDLIMVDHDSGEEKIIDSTTILTSKRINSDETNKFTFTFKLPGSIPVSSNTISYKFNTKLVFDEGVVSKDQDYIQIV